MAKFTAADIEEQLAQLDLNSQSTSSSAASLQQADWRQSVGSELRIHYSEKLFQALVAVCDPQSVNVEQTKNNAGRIESEVFEVAKSRTEYCELISRRINQIQNKEQQSWRETVAVEIRKQIVKKLMQTIIPGCDVEDVGEQGSMRNLMEYAQKVEHDTFQIATSRTDYYKLIAEKIYSAQQGLSEESCEEEMEECES